MGSYPIFQQGTAPAVPPPAVPPSTSALPAAGAPPAAAAPTGVTDAHVVYARLASQNLNAGPGDLLKAMPDLGIMRATQVVNEVKAHFAALQQAQTAGAPGAPTQTVGGAAPPTAGVGRAGLPVPPASTGGSTAPPASTQTAGAGQAGLPVPPASTGGSTAPGAQPERDPALHPAMNGPLLAAKPASGNGPYSGLNSLRYAPGGTAPGGPAAPAPPKADRRMPPWLIRALTEFVPAATVALLSRGNPGAGAAFLEGNQAGTEQFREQQQQDQEAAQRASDRATETARYNAQVAREDQQQATETDRYNAESARQARQDAATAEQQIFENKLETQKELDARYRASSGVRDSFDKMLLEEDPDSQERQIESLTNEDAEALGIDRSKFYASNGNFIPVKGSLAERVKNDNTVASGRAAALQEKAASDANREQLGEQMEGLAKQKLTLAQQTEVERVRQNRALDVHWDHSDFNAGESANSKWLESYSGAVFKQWVISGRPGVVAPDGTSIYQTQAGKAWGKVFTAAVAARDKASVQQAAASNNLSIAAQALDKARAAGAAPKSYTEAVKTAEAQVQSAMDNVNVLDAQISFMNNAGPPTSPSSQTPRSMMYNAVKAPPYAPPAGYRPGTLGNVNPLPPLAPRTIGADAGTPNVPKAPPLPKTPPKAPPTAAQSAARAKLNKILGL